ncbi:unnamed protein product [Enterobius vermicularis]|uniref:Cystatin domain-containing protein n=1 Tax=Enterobius vermicularis TaxID=51028 RepID=A0A0N4UVP1_ENTVE|nr:unnamed protein product [Enterobius vermicularis]
MATRAVAKYNAERNGIYYMEKEDVKSAKEELGPGYTYVLEILVQESACKTTDMTLQEHEKKNCLTRLDGKKEIVTASVRQKPWENFEEIKIIESKEV